MISTPYRTPAQSTPMVNPAYPSISGPTPGGRLVPGVGADLPLRATSLRVEAAAGLARVVLSQTFANHHAEPLRVTYRLPLPADGAVSGFAFTIGERRVVGTVDEIGRARETFERAIVEGRTAALLEEERSSLFTQELGNVPPGAEVVAEIVIDQPLAWSTTEGAWEWRFPLAAAPRYLGAGGGVGDERQVTLDVAESDLPVRASLELDVRDALTPGRSPESPSHPLQVVAVGAGSRVTLGGGGGVALDRDLVVRWPVALPTASVTFDAGRAALADGTTACCALLTVAPPLHPTAGPMVARDLVLLLDTSGSMGGEPLAQAKRVASALVESLLPSDTVEILEFSTATRRFLPKAELATPALKARALAWLRSLEAGGGTEMLGGITTALASLRPEAQRQVVVVTDGLIGFESEVVGAIARQLPRGSRVHALGVGSSTNRTLLAGIARVGAGIEVILGLGEDPERAATRLLAHTVAPVLVDLTIEGEALLEQAPARLADLYAGAPARLTVRVRPEGGTLVVRGRTATGSWEQAVTIPAGSSLPAADAPAKRFARERVLDLETDLSRGRARAEVDAELVALGVRYQISTRCTSWVAVSAAPTVDPTLPTRREEVPQQLPHGMSAAGMGLRVASPPPMQAMSVGRMISLNIPHPAMAAPMAPPPPPPPMPGRMPARMAPSAGPAGFGGPPGMMGGPPPPPAAPASMPSKRKEAADEGRAEESFGAPPEAKAAPAPASSSAPAPEPAPASEGAAPLAKAGLLGSIARRVRGFFASERQTTGRFVFQQGGLWVLEIDTGTEAIDLAWEGATIVVIDGAGHEEEVAIALGSSTRPGVVGVGLTFRLAVHPPASIAAPASLRLVFPGGPALLVTLAPR
jgi:Ca-activated chloride channel family protein